MTLRQLRGFGGIIGYCRIWIPGYGELARPLYKLIAETQQAQTDKLVWSPETQKAFKVLHTALLQAPALSLRASPATCCLSKQRIRCNLTGVATLPKSNWGSGFIST